MKQIKNPKMNENLSEFLGICLGDGNLCLGSSNNRLTISGDNKEDVVYLRKHVNKLIFYLFGLQPKFRIQDNTLDLIVDSKKLVIFLNESGLPIGPKNNTKIPDCIKNNEKMLLSFIRGYTDTDGNLSFKAKSTKHHKHYYPVISISSKNLTIIQELKNTLTDYDFLIGKIIEEKKIKLRNNETYKSYRIFINGKQQLERWMNLIGFNNPKHQTKYNIWRKHGFCEPRTALEKECGPQSVI